MTRITVNGEVRTLTEPQTIGELLRDFGFSGKPVAVEVNQRIVPREDHESHLVAENDVIEIVTAVGGG